MLCQIKYILLLFICLSITADTKPFDISQCYPQGWHGICDGRNLAPGAGSCPVPIAPGWCIAGIVGICSGYCTAWLEQTGF